MKTVVVEMKILMLVDVQDDSTISGIESFLNESSHCTDNEIENLANNLMVGSCLSCANSNFTFLREATEHDLLNIPDARSK